MADERDPKVSRHYAGLEPLAPPRELDQTIVAAAHRAADAPRAPLVAPAGRQRWYYSLAAAAVMVFAVAVTVHMERERPDSAAAPHGTPPPLRLERELRGTIKPAAEPQAKPAETKPRVGREPEPAQSFAPDPQAAARDSLAAAPAAPSAPREAAPIAPQASAKSRPSAEATITAQARRADEATSRADAANAGALARRAPAAEMRLRREEALASPYAAAPAAEPAAPPAAAREKPDRWLERIAELRSRGRHAEADKELAEFRRVYPDYPLSELMRERVEGR